MLHAHGFHIIPAKEGMVYGTKACPCYKKSPQVPILGKIYIVVVFFYRHGHTTSSFHYQKLIFFQKSFIVLP